MRREGPAESKRKKDRMSTKDLAVETDTKLADLYGKLFQEERSADSVRDSIRKAESGVARYAYLVRDVPVYKAQLADVQKRIADLEAEIAPLDAIYREHMWSRFIVCEHVHSSTACHTLRPTSRVYWLPQLSGSNQAEIVDQLGEAACTVCFPDAPVHKPNTIELDPEKAARKAERAARSAALAAKREEAAIYFPDGSVPRERSFRTNEFSGAEYKNWKTVQNKIADLFADLVWCERYSSVDMAPIYQSEIEYLLPALAHKLSRPVEELRTELKAKGDKKAR